MALISQVISRINDLGADIILKHQHHHVINGK